MLKDIPLFQDLTADERKILETCLHEKTYEKGEVLFLAGTMCKRVFFVASGKIKLYRTSASGKEQVLEVLGGGETCACNAEAQAFSCASTGEALMPTTVWYLSKPDYLRLVHENPNIARKLLQILTDKLFNIGGLVEEISLMNVKERLVKFLLDMLKDQTKGEGKDEVLILPFTREEIAHQLGSARETVARNLHQLKQDKLIDIKPHQIVILDKNGLESLL